MHENDERFDSTPQPSMLEEQVALARMFGDRVRALRVAAGLSPDELGGRCGLVAGTVVKAERGRPEPRLWLIVQLCRGLGVTPNQLLAGMVDARGSTGAS